MFMRIADFFLYLVEQEDFTKFNMLGKVAFNKKGTTCDDKGISMINASILKGITVIADKLNPDTGKEFNIIKKAINSKKKYYVPPSESSYKFNYVLCLIRSSTQIIPKR
jgi:hypothetical protein